MSRIQEVGVVLEHAKIIPGYGGGGDGTGTEVIWLVLWEDWFEWWSRASKA